MRSLAQSVLKDTPRNATPRHGMNDSDKRTKLYIYIYVCLDLPSQYTRYYNPFSEPGIPGIVRMRGIPGRTENDPQ